MRNYYGTFRSDSRLPLDGEINNTGHVDAAGALSDHLDHPFVPTYWSLGKQPRLISATAVILMANNLASSRRPSHLGDCGYYYGK